MGLLLSFFPGKIWVYLAMAAVIVAGTGYAVHHWDQVAYLRLQQSITVANEKALVAATAKQKKIDDVSHAAEVAYLKAHPVIVTQTQTVIRNVNHYITEKADTNFPLSLGFCILHNAAASGSGAAATSSPASIADDAPCSVRASEAAAVIAGNYGKYREVAAQLVALQDWITEEAKILETNNSATRP